MLPSFPRLLRHGDVAYLDDSDCVRWRVVDLTLGTPHAALDDAARLPLGSPDATIRVFRRRDRDAGRRVYAFHAGEPRELDPARLLRQLRSGRTVLPDHQATNAPLVARAGA